MASGWKTAAFALAITILGAVETFITDSNLIGPETQGTVLMVIGAMVGALRYVTNTPMFKSEPPAAIE